MASDFGLFCSSLFFRFALDYGSLSATALHRSDTNSAARPHTLAEPFSDTTHTVECSLPTHDAYQGSSEHSAPAKKTNPPRIRTRRPLRTPAATSSLPDATREAPQRPARLPPALSRPRPVSRPFLSSPIVCVATPARLGSGPAGSRPVTLPYLPRLSFSSQPPCSRASRHTFTPSQ